MKNGIALTGKIVPIFNPVSWQKKAFSARKYRVPAATKAALGARIALAESASKNFGTRGKINGLPGIAAKVRAECAGKTHGGMSRKQIADEKHSTAAGSIAAMRTTYASL